MARISTSASTSLSSKLNDGQVRLTNIGPANPAQDPAKLVGPIREDAKCASSLHPVVPQDGSTGIQDAGTTRIAAVVVRITVRSQRRPPGVGCSGGKGLARVPRPSGAGRESVSRQTPRRRRSRRGEFWRSGDARITSRSTARGPAGCRRSPPMVFDGLIGVPATRTSRRGARRAGRGSRGGPSTSPTRR